MSYLCNKKVNYTLLFIDGLEVEIYTILSIHKYIEHPTIDFQL